MSFLPAVFEIPAFVLFAPPVLEITLITFGRMAEKYCLCFRAASVSARLSEKFSKLWITAEVILFVLVGAVVDIRYTSKAAIGSVPLS